MEASVRVPGDQYVSVTVIPAIIQNRVIASLHRTLVAESSPLTSWEITEQSDQNRVNDTDC